MRSFVRKLSEEGKIKLTEPSKEVCRSYLEKSEQSLRSAKMLITIQSYNDAVALTYYSMYYAALALLYRCGVKSENHTGTILLLHDIFALDNASIAHAKKERVDKQYYVDFKAAAEDVRQGIDAAEAFKAEIREFIAKLKETDIKKYNEKGEQLLRQF